MAAGFSESYIRIWSLKGAKLPAMRTDFDSDHIVTGETKSGPYASKAPLGCLTGPKLTQLRT
jgi:hypothetical protein